jgi:hypothetical protein
MDSPDVAVRCHISRNERTCVQSLQDFESTHFLTHGALCLWVDSVTQVWSHSELSSQKCISRFHRWRDRPSRAPGVVIQDLTELWDDARTFHLQSQSTNTFTSLNWVLERLPTSTHPLKLCTFQFCLASSSWQSHTLSCCFAGYLGVCITNGFEATLASSGVKLLAKCSLLFLEQNRLTPH